MAMIEVETLTENCWEKCEDVNIVKTSFFTQDAIINTVFQCEHVNRCKRIAKAIEEGLKELKR